MNGKKKYLGRASEFKSTGKYYQFLYYFKVRFMLAVLLLCVLDLLLEANKHS